METYQARAMGSPLRLVTHRLPAVAGRRAWRALADDVEASEQALSRFRVSSDLSRLNAAARCVRGAWHAPDRRLVAMLTAAWRAQRATGGRFDARVILALEALGERAGVPLPLEPPRHSPDDPWLERSGRRRVRLLRPVDSGGIGKGLALRWAARAARRAAGTRGGLLLEAGGDLVMDGPGPDAGAWSVAIEHPRRLDEPTAVLRGRDAAIATSSVAVRRWIGPDGEPVHHLLDPRTGHPAQPGLLSVTVLDADPAWAEVWSKALFLAGADEIGPEARRRGMAAWWVDADGSLHMTPAARTLTIWTAGEAGVAAEEAGVA